MLELSTTYNKGRVRPYGLCLVARWPHIAISERWDYAWLPTERAISWSPTRKGGFRGQAQEQLIPEGISPLGQLVILDETYQQAPGGPVDGGGEPHLESNSQKIAAKIKALLNKTVENGATEDEALAAASKAASPPRHWAWMGKARRKGGRHRKMITVTAKTHGLEFAAVGPPSCHRSATSPVGFAATVGGQLDSPS